MCTGYEQTSKQTRRTYKTHFKQVEHLTIMTVGLKPGDELQLEQKDSAVQLPSGLYRWFSSRRSVCSLRDHVCWSSQPAWKLLGEGTAFVVLSLFNFSPVSAYPAPPTYGWHPRPTELPTLNTSVSIMAQRVAQGGGWNTASGADRPRRGIYGLGDAFGQVFDLRQVTRPLRLSFFCKMER